MAVRNIKLTIVYDGSEYHGWQIQPGEKTIQGILTEAVEGLIGREVRITGASRTDAGVSALGQIALMQIESAIPTENLAKAITDRLPADIAVAEAAEAAPDFDVISDVKSKLYRYTIFTGMLRPVLRIRHCRHLPAKLDIAAMAKGAKLFIGKKDFKSFASAADKREDSVRTIVGTLVEVGIGRLDPEKIGQILEAKDRKAAGPIAPAQGLCLMWIKY